MATICDDCTLWRIVTEYRTNGRGVRVSGSTVRLKHGYKRPTTGIMAILRLSIVIDCSDNTKIPPSRLLVFIYRRHSDSMNSTASCNDAQVSCVSDTDSACSTSVSAPAALGSRLMSIRPQLSCGVSSVNTDMRVTRIFVGVCGFVSSGLASFFSSFTNHLPMLK